jgi:hypothetical protein
VSLATRLRLRGWRLWLAVVLLVLALFVFFFSACGRGEGQPADPPAATEEVGG